MNESKSVEPYEKRNASALTLSQSIPFRARSELGQKYSHHGIAVKFLIFIFAFSSFVTIVATAIQLYTDFKRDVGQIETRLSDIEVSYLSSIEASLWNMDIDQLNVQLEGILRFPDVTWVELAETQTGIKNPLLLSMGEKVQAGSSKAQSFPIVYKDDYNTIIELGELRVETSLTEIYDRLLDRATVILFSQGIKTFLVSLFIVFMVHKLITRHLQRISEHVQRFSLSDEAPPLVLLRRARKHPDELDSVVFAHNRMAENLRDTYGHLKQANFDLEQDIAARKQAEAEISRLNTELESRVDQRTSELEAANKELSSFCYSVSHDLRAPLRRIEGFRQILLKQYSESFDEKGMHYLSRIEVGTQEMSDMIDSFLKLSRSTNTMLSVEPVDLSELSQKICDRILEREPEKPFELILEADLVEQADKRLVEILLTNLLQNAWKYSQKKERVVIEFGKQGTSEGSNVYFVKDNGAGFEMKQSEHLFKPFTRLHASSEFEGSGIGLATVQRIAARHGGKVWCEAEVDKGATFFFTIGFKE